MGKRMKKSVGRGALCILLLVLSTGCGKSFDASDYVRAVLDLDVKEDAGPIEKYVRDREELEEVKAEYAEEREKLGETWFEGYDLSQETRKEWQGLLSDILKNARYTVGEAEKTEDGYVVEVDVEPIYGVFQDLETPVKEGCAAYYGAHKNGVTNGTTPEGEIDNRVCRIFFDAVRENMEDMTYADTQTVTVEIGTEDGLSLSGMEEVGECLIDYTGFEDFDLWAIWQEAVGFDAAGYVEATLDLVAKGDTETIKDYLVDPEEIGQDRQQQYWDELIGDGYAELGLSDGVLAGLREMYIEMFKKTSYTVGEAVKAGDGSYTVDVTVEPLTGIFDGLWDGIDGELTAYAQANADGIANGSVTEEDIYNASLSMMVNAAKKNIDNAYYKEAQTTTVRVEEKDGLYEISEEDMMDVYGLMLDTSGLDEFF